MKCPKCSYEMTCPCQHCQARKPTDNAWVWIDGEFIQCKSCQHTDHCDNWDGSK